MTNPRLEALALSLARLGAVGLIAVGLSGLLAGGLGLAFGKGFVSGDLPGVTYTAERCAEFREYYPEPTCEAAATAHHFDEVVFYRLDAGALGLLGLAAIIVLGKVRPGFGRQASLHPAIVPAVGASVFGLATLGLLGYSVSEPAFADDYGVGALLSGGMVALVPAAFYSRRLVAALT